MQSPHTAGLAPNLTPAADDHPQIGPFPRPGSSTVAHSLSNQEDVVNIPPLHQDAFRSLGRRIQRPPDDSPAQSSCPDAASRQDDKNAVSRHRPIVHRFACCESLNITQAPPIGVPFPGGRKICPQAWRRTIASSCASTVPRRASVKLFLCDRPLRNPLPPVRPGSALRQRTNSRSCPWNM